jgi:hypothetical protein
MPAIPPALNEEPVLSVGSVFAELSAEIVAELVVVMVVVICAVARVNVSKLDETGEVGLLLPDVVLSVEALAITEKYEVECCSSELFSTITKQYEILALGSTSRSADGI